MVRQAPARPGKQRWSPCGGDAAHDNPGSGNPAIQDRCPRTGGFASPPCDGFAKNAEIRGSDYGPDVCQRNVRSRAIAGNVRQSAGCGAVAQATAPSRLRLDSRTIAGMAHPDAKRFWKELLRRRVVRVAVFYIAGAWILAQAIDLLLDAFDASHYMRFVVAGLGVGLPVALVLAWVFDITPSGIERT